VTVLGLLIPPDWGRRDRACDGRSGRARTMACAPRGGVLLAVIWQGVKR